MGPMRAPRLPWFIAAASMACLPACENKDGKAAPDASPAASSQVDDKPPASPQTPEAPVKAELPDLEQQCEQCATGKCSMSDAEACFQLALRCEAGDGVPQDTNRARSLLQKASSAGHAKARQRLRKTWGL